ncbi:hypothetical protein C8J57DRAFT_1055811 [Mycena rebaudengoi]|nr:hypothetical protein C8J57DRAFT_1055811 [Mycena rebaudengoi]
MEVPSPSRPRPPPLRLDHVGINPSDLVGKVLKSVRRSEKHPSLTLSFADGTKVQVMVDGYDPIHSRPKELEMDPSLNTILQSPDLSLTVIDCALITLSDKAFELRQNDQWDQRHLGVAFKFAEDGAKPWHCVWAILQAHPTIIWEHDERGECVFRTYDDVYLQRSPRKSRNRKKSGPSPTSS